MTTNAQVRRAAVSVEEAARLLGIGRTLAYEAVRSGELPSIRIGKRYVVSLTALEEMLIGPTDRTEDTEIGDTRRSTS